jgi:hypothetical protein
MTDRGYLPFSEKEMRDAFAYAREHPVYRIFAPPDDRPMMNWHVLRRIGIDVARKRDEADEKYMQLDLMFMTGSVVREHVPDVDRSTRELGGAYKGLASFIFTGRKEWVKKRRLRKRSRSTRKGAGGEQSPADDTGQYRLL